MSKYGIGANDLTAINPRLVYASSTGYGNAEGPYRDYLGMDITLQAVSGVMSVTGEEGGGPLKSAAALPILSLERIFMLVLLPHYLNGQQPEKAASLIFPCRTVFSQHLRLR